MYTSTLLVPEVFAGWFDFEALLLLLFQRVAFGLFCYAAFFVVFELSWW